MKTIDEITDLLLAGKISVAKAEELTKGMKLGNVDYSEINKEGRDYVSLDKEGLEESVLEEDGKLLYEIMAEETDKVEVIEQIPLIVGNAEFPKSKIQYSLIKHPNGDKYFFLDSAYSYEEGQGHFRTLFDQLVDIASEFEIPFLELHVKKDNLDAKSIYEHLGFIKLGTVKKSPAYYCMRKDLDIE